MATGGAPPARGAATSLLKDEKREKEKKMEGRERKGQFIEAPPYETGKKLGAH